MVKLECWENVNLNKLCEEEFRVPNIMRADCGFDPTDVEKFEEVTVELLNDPSGLDLDGH